MEQRTLYEAIKKNLSKMSFNFSVFFAETRHCIAIELFEASNILKKEIGCVIYENLEVKNFYSFLTLYEVEQVMSPLLRKYGFIGGVDGELMITTSIQKLEPNLYAQTFNPTYPKVIENEQDAIELLKDLNTYTQQVAEPFFEKWSDLRVLNQFLDNCPQMEISDYLGGYGAYSKLLVYKLCNNPKYSEYLEMMYNHAMKRYKENPDGDKVIKQKHDFMIDFKEVLDKTEAVYNI